MLNFISFSGFSKKVMPHQYQNSFSKVKSSKIKQFKMLYNQTFQHRARLSVFSRGPIFRKNKKELFILPQKLDLSVSQNTRKKISLSKKGKRIKKSTAHKISNSLKGRVFSDKHKFNLKKALSGIKNPMFGRLHSKFVKRKISKNLANGKSSLKKED